MNTIDIFCGCGGLSYGFIKEGFKIIHAFDNWDSALKIYNDNFLHKAEKYDVNSLSSNYLKQYNPDLIIGGPPCQDYSSAGKRDENLGRADLTKRYAELICEVKPKWFVMENVDQITRSKTLPKAIELYKKSNYGLTKVILDASLCGVPQKRKRFFLIGELNGQDDFLKEKLLNNQSQKSMSIFDYLGKEFEIEFYYRHPRSYQRRGIFSIYEPSPTIRGVNRPIPPNYKSHKGDATHNLSIVRPLTTLERARIQTFPKSYKFSGSKTDLEQAIGNAVPVELASYVAHILKEYIKTKEKFYDTPINEQIKIDTPIRQMNFSDVFEL